MAGRIIHLALYGEPVMELGIMLQLFRMELYNLCRVILM